MTVKRRSGRALLSSGAPLCRHTVLRCGSRPRSAKGRIMKSTQTARRRRRPAFVAVAGVVALSTGVIVLAPGLANASSHREAPLIAGDPRVDNTDVYAFVSKDAPDSVNLVANFIPFEEPNGGP